MGRTDVLHGHPCDGYRVVVEAHSGRKAGYIMPEHLTWWLLNMAGIAWYIGVVWYVALFGAKDIRSMLDHLRDRDRQ